MLLKWAPGNQVYVIDKQHTLNKGIKWTPSLTPIEQHFIKTDLICGQNMH